MLYLIAAALTLAAWGVQAYVTVAGKSNRISPWLPLLYAGNCALFLAAALMAGDWLYTILNAVLLVLVAGTAVFLLRLK